MVFFENKSSLKTLYLISAYGTLAQSRLSCYNTPVSTSRRKAHRPRGGEYIVDSVFQLVAQRRLRFERK